MAIFKITRELLSSSLVFFAGKEVSYSSLLEVNSGVRIGDEIGDGLRASVIDNLEGLEAKGELFASTSFERENGITVDIFESELYVATRYYDEKGETIYNVFALDEIDE